jgi:hypothetical protein
MKVKNGFMLVLTTLESKHDPFANGFLSIRNNGTSMTASKASIVKALTDIAESYDYLVGPNNLSYPTGVKEEMKTYAGIFRDAVAKMITAINGNGVFYLPPEEGNIFDLTSWPTSGPLGINVGKFFTPGTFSLDKFIESENNKPIFYMMEYGEDGVGLLTQESVDEIKAFIDENGIDNIIDIRIGILIQMDGLISEILVEDEPSYNSDFIWMPLEVGLALYDFYYKLDS